MDVASIAIAYITFGGVLVGFAFAGLCVYLNQAPGSRGQDDSVVLLVPRRGDPLIIAPISVSEVASTGFYAMTSLAMSTFLYADLAGQAKQRPEAAVAALLPYGILLALSVLALFYFVVLMMFEHPLTRPAARSAFWAVTIVGSLVVLRFLAGSARDAEGLRCPSTGACVPWLFSGSGISITLLATFTIYVFVTFSRILEWRWWRRILRGLMNRPDLPPFGVFAVTVAVTTLVSLYINTRPVKYVPPDALIEWSYYAGIVLILLFALSSGCVVYPRVHDDIRLHSTDLIGEVRSARSRFPVTKTLLVLAPATILSAAISVAYLKSSPTPLAFLIVCLIIFPIFAFAFAIAPPFFGWRGRDRYGAGPNRTVNLRYISGTRPSYRNEQLVWALQPRQPADAELTTEFKLSGAGDNMRLRGNLHVSDIISGPPSSDERIVEITVKGPTDKPMVEKRICTTQGPVELMDVIGRTETLDVVLRRIDECPETVLLYWVEPRGEIDTTSRPIRPPVLTEPSSS